MFGEPAQLSMSGSGRSKLRVRRAGAVRTITVSRLAKLASKFFAKSFSPPSRAVAFDELSGAHKSMSFSAIVTNADGHVTVEWANRYRAGRLQRVADGRTQIISAVVHGHERLLLSTAAIWLASPSIGGGRPRLARLRFIS
jgi:hypothetical protein